MRLIQRVLSFFSAAPTARPAEATAKAVVTVVRNGNGPPQSEREINEFVERMRHSLNDPLLDIRWEPEFKLLERGRYLVTGKLIPPVYDGRYQVIRYKTDGGRPDREYVIICTVRDYVEQDGMLVFEDKDDAGFQPVDDRLLTLLRQADAANVRAFTEFRRRFWARHDKAEEEEGRINEGEAREGLDRAHFKGNYAGGVGNWKGRGADFGAMEAAAKSRLITP